MHPTLRNLVIVALALLPTLILASCGVQPVSPDIESAGVESYRIVEAQPPAQGPMEFPPDQPGPFLTGRGENCDSLVDVDLKRAYELLDAFEFWTFHVNFNQSVSEILDYYDPAPGYYGCFLLYARSEISRTYVALDRFLITPCYEESLNGSDALDVSSDYAALSSGLDPDRDGSWITRTVQTRSVGFGEDAYLRCKFNLRDMVKQYRTMVDSRAITLPPEVTSNGTQSRDSVVWTDYSETNFLPYEHYGMVAAITDMALDEDVIDNSWADYLSGVEAFPDIPLPATHPAIVMIPNCLGGNEVPAGDFRNQMEQLSTDFPSETPFALDPYGPIQRVAEGESSLCYPSIQLNLTALPSAEVTNHGGDPDKRMTVSTYVKNAMWHSNYTELGITNCITAPNCTFAPLLGAVQPQYIWMQFGNLARINTMDPCLLPRETLSGTTWVRWAEHTNSSGGTDHYDYYMTLSHQPPGTTHWQTWCSPSLAPSVLDNAQSALDFYLGDTDIFVGFNPFTGDHFKGRMNEIWIDPDTGVGT